MSASTDITAIGDRLHHVLRKRVDATTYNLWLTNLAISELSEGSLELTVPLHVHAWVRARFSDTLASCATEALGRPVRLALASANSAGAPTGADRLRGAAVAGACETSASSAVGDDPDQLDSDGSQRLSAWVELRSQRPNPTLTFNRFVIGESNRLAHSAALTTAELPGSAYNPLFIFGPPGCGKTHLLHALGAVATFSAAPLNLLLTTGEAFTASFISALQRRASALFKASINSVDILLIDDASFIAGKRRTEDELLYAFNTVIERGGQVVFVFERSPETIPWVSDCLRERLHSGLAVEIERPDLSLRKTLVRRTLLEHGVEDVQAALIERLALAVPGNLRSLQSALMRSLAYASLKGEKLGLDAVETVLSTFYTGLADISAPALIRPAVRHGATHQPATIAEIQERTATYFGIEREQLLCRSRAKSLVWPRQVAMYLAREHLRLPLQDIGSAFSGRDHATVLHACRRVKQRLDDDHAAREQVESILAGADNATSSQQQVNAAK
jgi:chromosomal replication initiator protein